MVHLQLPYYQAFQIINNILMSIFVHTLLFVFRYILSMLPHWVQTSDLQKVEKVERLYLFDMLDLAYKNSTMVAILRRQ